MTQMTVMRQKKRGKSRKIKRQRNLIVVRRRKAVVSRTSGVREPPQQKREPITK